MAIKDIVKTIYGELNDTFIFDKTPQVEKAFDDYRGKYIEPNYKIDYDKANEQEEAFMEALLCSRERAFEVGFKTAIKFVLSCNEM